MKAGGAGAQGHEGCKEEGQRRQGESEADCRLRCAPRTAAGEGGEEAVRGGREGASVSRVKEEGRRQQEEGRPEPWSAN